MLIGTLPVINNPEEFFNITILDNVYSIRQLWNTIGFWTIDIFDADGNPLVHGVKLISGIFILAQYPEVTWDLLINEAVDPVRTTLESSVVEVHSK